jgi:hypothetical protein
VSDTPVTTTSTTLSPTGTTIPKKSSAKNP